MDKGIPVVDLFAGPGGLGEGFSSLGRNRFEITISAEMDECAHQTLLLRSFYRILTPTQRRNFYYPLVESGISRLTSDLFPASGVAARAWKKANEDARKLTIGNTPDDRVLKSACRKLAVEDRPWVLIGGPPCQAYSQVGRIKNRALKGYSPDEDERFFLYRHYLEIVANYGPAAFVMENVAGMLSATFSGGRIVGHILDHISGIRISGRGYRLFSLSTPSTDPAACPKDFLVSADDHGVPQARRRVIILGVREDVLNGGNSPGLLSFQSSKVSAGSGMGGLPPLRSTLNKKGANRSNVDAWNEAVHHEYLLAARACRRAGQNQVASVLTDSSSRVAHGKLDWDAAGLELNPGQVRQKAESAGMPKDLADWLLRPGLTRALNHQARGHMPSDLGRYGFCAAYGQHYGHTPKSHEFPAELAPDHKNWESGHWADRFRVVIKNEPSRTVVKHIAKDGHYYIHPDPVQCRSLTVREAARLQTFPDDYYFLGGRTSAYGQVGNAVPPYLAKQIAEIVWDIVS